MANRKPGKKKSIVYTKVNDPIRPLWKKVIWWTVMIVISVLGILFAVGMVMKYYRLVTRH
jgi:predicted transcriptional regulator